MRRVVCRPCARALCAGLVVHMRRHHSAFLCNLFARVGLLMKAQRHRHASHLVPPSFFMGVWGGGLAQGCSSLVRGLVRVVRGPLGRSQVGLRAARRNIKGPSRVLGYIGL